MSIQAALDKLGNRGGLLQLDCNSYDINNPIIVDTPSLCLSGGTWACNADPNGVFESSFGTKIRCRGTNYPALLIGQERTSISGTIVRDLGIQGDISGMDTRPLVDFYAPMKAAGLCFSNARTDQCHFSKLSFCGLSNAVVATENSELDACLFENLNADGCGNGFWFSPKASYYTRVRACVIADNPYYGLYLGGSGKHIHNFEILDCYFVRNGGAFETQYPQPAAVYFDQVSDCAVTNCIFDAPGTFWYYDDDATKNEQRQPSHRKTTALYITGQKNRIRNNTFLNSSADSIRIVGDENILMGNIVDGNVRISGAKNVVSGLVFTNPEARLILEEQAADSTIIQAVESGRIVIRKSSE